MVSDKTAKLKICEHQPRNFKLGRGWGTSGRGASTHLQLQGTKVAGHRATTLRAGTLYSTSGSLYSHARLPFLRPNTLHSIRLQARDLPTFKMPTMWLSDTQSTPLIHSLHEHTLTSP